MSSVSIKALKMINEYILGCGYDKCCTTILMHIWCTCTGKYFGYRMHWYCFIVQLPDSPWRGLIQKI